MALSSFWSDAISLAPAIVSAFTSNRETGAEKQQRQALARQQELIAAANDPSSDIYKNQVATDEAGRRSDYAKSIQELINAQRRQTTMGRNPLLDPERADETLNRLQTQGYTDAARDARLNATNTILNMANAQSGAAGNYGGMVSNAQSRQGARSNTMYEIAKGITGIVNQNRSSQPTAQDIVWDQPRQQGRVVMSEQPPSQGNTILGSLMSRSSGGQNMANTAFNQQAQYSGTRSNRGGRSFA